MSNSKDNKKVFILLGCGCGCLTLLLLTPIIMVAILTALGSQINSTVNTINETLESVNNNINADIDYYKNSLDEENSAVERNTSPDSEIIEFLKIIVSEFPDAKASAVAEKAISSYPTIFSKKPVPDKTCLFVVDENTIKLIFFNENLMPAPEEFFKISQK